MSSYLPPRKNLSKFNAEEFKSSLSEAQLKTKLKTSESKLKTTVSASLSQYIDSGTYTTDGTNTGDASISFNVTFTAPPILICTLIKNVETRVRCITIKSTSVTGAILHRRKTYSTGGGDSQDNSDFNWIAIGTIN